MACSDQQAIRQMLRAVGTSWSGPGVPTAKSPDSSLLFTLRGAGNVSTPHPYEHEEEMSSLPPGVELGITPESPRRAIRSDTGEIAVLYSPGYGAGWYSWIGHEAALFDPEVVRWILDGKPAASRPDIDDGRYGEYAYDGGMDKLCIAWVKPGTLFEIHEYDGNESIRFNNEERWIVA